MKLASCLIVVAGFLLFAADRSRNGKNQQWPVVGGGPEGMRSPRLTRSTAGTCMHCNRLGASDSGDEYEGSELQCNPIVVDGVLYAATPRLRIIALDAATGKLLWDFDARRGETVKGKQRNRGLTYWAEGSDRRPIFRPGSLALLTRRTLRTTRERFRRRWPHRSSRGSGPPDPEGLTVQANSPGAVYRDLLILGMLTSEDLPSAPGFIRA